MGSQNYASAWRDEAALMQKKDYAALIVSFAAVLALFSIGITDGHIGLDDWGYTSGCPFVKDGLRLSNIARAFSDFGYGAIWMPLTFISYMVDISLFGDSWKAYHAVNVALHLVNVFLVFVFLRRCSDEIFKAKPAVPAFLVALVSAMWALHPMRAEAVTFVASRKEELWAMFSLSGLISYMSFLKKSPADGVVSYAVAVVFFVLACLSKPTAMCFPFLALSIAVMLGRLDRRVWLSLAPLFVLSACVGALTVYSQSNPTGAAAVDVYDTSFWWRVLNAAVSSGLYVWYTFWPLNVHIDYRAVFNGWPVDGWLGLCVFAAVLCLSVAVYFRSGRDWRGRLAGVAMFVAFSIGPTLGVLGYVNGDQSIADRYAYLPHVGVGLVSVFAIGVLLERGVGALKIAACCIAIAVCEFVMALPVVKSYENGYTVCSRALEKDPENWRALRIVGNEYCARLNRVDEGVRMLRKSLRIRPSRSTAESLAYVLAIRGETGDFAEVERLGSAVAKNPSLDEGGMMLDALGIVCMKTGRHEKAVDYFYKSLNVPKRNHSPDYALLYLGLNLASCGKKDEAAMFLSDACKSRIKDVASQAKSALCEISGTGY